MDRDWDKGWYTACIQSLFSVSPCTGIYVRFTTFNSDMRCVENCIKCYTAQPCYISAVTFAKKRSGRAFRHETDMLNSNETDVKECEYSRTEGVILVVSSQKVDGAVTEHTLLWAHQHAVFCTCTLHICIDTDTYTIVSNMSMFISEQPGKLNT